MHKPPLTIDPSLYARDFSPLQPFVADMTSRSGPAQTAIGDSGVAAIRLSTMGARVGATVHTSCAPFPTPENTSRRRIASITETAGDFTHNAKTDTDVSIDGIIVSAEDFAAIAAADADPQGRGKYPKNWRAGVAVPLLADHEYFINYINVTPGPGGEMRLQVSHTP